MKRGLLHVAGIALWVLFTVRTVDTIWFWVRILGGMR